MDIITVRVKPAETVVVSGTCGNLNAATNVDINSDNDAKQVLMDGCVYMINKNNLNIVKVEGHTQTERMQSPPPGASITLDLGGSHVNVTNSSTGYAEKDQTSTIIRVNENSSLTLMNTGTADRNWGVGVAGSVGHDGNRLYRVDSTVAVNGGRFYAIGGDNGFGISRAHNYNFYGPHINNDTKEGEIYHSQQGAINIEGEGGYVLLDGGVAVKETHHGITSFSTDPTPQSTLADHNVEITVNIRKGASITCKGNDNKPSYGICLQRNSGNTIVDDIDIMVANSKIDCIDTNPGSAAIRLVNIHGDPKHPIEINLTTATLNHSGTRARAIVLENCSYISITYDSTTRIYGNNSFTGCSNITVNGVLQ